MRVGYNLVMYIDDADHLTFTCRQQEAYDGRLAPSTYFSVKFMLGDEIAESLGDEIAATMDGGKA